MSKLEDLVLQLNEKLLQAVGSGDYETYASLCDPTLTCFEPEAMGHLVGGLGFHKFYFDAPSAPGGATHVLNSMSNPHVRMMGTSAAVISYVRLTQKVGPSCIPETNAVQETRVWELKNGNWLTRLDNGVRFPGPLTLEQDKCYLTEGLLYIDQMTRNCEGWACPQPRIRDLPKSG